MTRWTCPKCGHAVKTHAAAKEVTHPCPERPVRGRPGYVALKPST